VPGAAFWTCLILRGSRSTLDVACFVLFANRIVRVASTGVNAQSAWQAWHFLVGESREVYEAWQLRGVLPLPDFSSCLMKGMLVVDPTLETGLRLRKGCIKVVWPPGTLARNAVMIGETPAAFVSQPFCLRSVVAQPSSAAANMLSKHGIAKSGNCKDLPACLSQGSVIYPRVCCLLRS
jgi:hypothetical protein